MDGSQDPKQETILLVGSCTRIERALRRAGFVVLTAPDPAAAAQYVSGADLVIQVAPIPAGLTERERQLVVLSTLGLTQQGIAQALRVAKGTIKTLRRRLSEKLWDKRHGMRPRGSGAGQRSGDSAD